MLPEDLVQMLELGYLFSLVRVDSLDGSLETSHSGSLSLLVVGDSLEHVLEAGNVEAQQPSHSIQQPSS